MINRRYIDVSAPNLMCICVDENDRGSERGRCYSRYSVEPSRFNDLNVLLLKMDRLMDRINFPQASTQSRDFFDRRETTERKEAERMRATDDILSQTGEKATFVVNIQYRQNATWQGKVFWAETGKSCNFRSALELLKLIDGALDEEEDAAFEPD